MEYLLCILTGYLFGSIPTAYLILKKVKGIDITLHGSGNVGAYNAYDISGSLYWALWVFLLDAFKGLLSVYLIVLVLPHNFIYLALTAIFAIVGHCYSYFIKFKGGRGLATAVGSVILIFPTLILIWCLGWLFSNLFSKNVIIKNVIATLFLMIFVPLFNNYILQYSPAHLATADELIMFTEFMSILILIKHISPLSDIIFKNSEDL